MSQAVTLARGPHDRNPHGAVAAQLWSAKSQPLLRVLSLSDGNQTVVERVQDAWLPQGRAEKRVFMVNVTLKFHGVCRHENLRLTPRPDRGVLEYRHHHDEGGQHQRHSHRPLNHAERFMELCDERFYGWMRYRADIERCPDASRSGPMSRFKGDLDRDKNRPAFVAWSCGNEMLRREHQAHSTI